MKKFNAALPLIMFVSACGHQAEPTATATATSSVTTAATVSSADTTVPAPGASTPLIADASADRFSCAYGGNKADQYEVVMTEFSPSDDHMGPIGDYKITGGGPYKDATGAVRLSDETYEFLDGPLGKVHAKIVPASQGFYALLIGKEGVQCEKQGSDAP